MSQTRNAVATALFVALVTAVPVSAGVIKMNADARAAEQAARAEQIALLGATSQIDGVLRTAVSSALQTTAAHAAAWDIAENAVASVQSAADEVADTTVAFRDLNVTVEEGETWETLADRWGLSGTELAAYNPELDINALRPGDEVRVYRFHPELPSVSRGAPNRGRLINGMPMPDGEHWVVRRPEDSWGTTQTVSALIRGFTATAEALPGGGTPLVADLSRRRGGRLSPHRSHTSGRDVDVTYYRTDPARTEIWERTRRSDFDTARQWELFRYWIERDLVSYIFIDNRLQRALYDYAAAQGEDPELLELAFGEVRGRGLLRYSPGHDDHFHVRFRCAPSDELCREH